MSLGAKIGAGVAMGRDKGHTCVCPRCGKETKNCTKACYNHRCPKCKVSMVGANTTQRKETKHADDKQGGVSFGQRKPIRLTPKRPRLKK